MNRKHRPAYRFAGTSLYRIPTPIQVATLYRTHGPEAAVERWFYLDAHVRQALRDEGEQLLQERAA
jgi:hypothetical protein